VNTMLVPFFHAGGRCELRDVDAALEEIELDVARPAWAAFLPSPELPGPEDRPFQRVRFRREVLLRVAARRLGPVAYFEVEEDVPVASSWLVIDRAVELPEPARSACDHPGCMSHTSHPCEGCGRQWPAPGTAARAVRDAPRVLAALFLRGGKL